MTGNEGDILLTEQEIAAVAVRDARRWRNELGDPARQAIKSIEREAKRAAARAESDRIQAENNARLAARAERLAHAIATRAPGHYWVVWYGEAKVAEWSGDGWWICGRGSLDFDEFEKVYETRLEPPA